MLPPDALKAWVEVAAHVVTAGTLLLDIAALAVGWRNYTLQTLQKRVEFFFEMWDQLRSPTTDLLGQTGSRRRLLRKREEGL
jgi:hypothetical protein